MKLFPMIGISVILLALPTQMLHAESLSEYGAKGDGLTDDTQSLRKAFRSDAKMLDGEGKSYRVYGTLEINRDMTLKNINLLQGEKEHQAELMKESHPRFYEKLRTRTLYFLSRNPEKKIRIHLENISIHRGLDETAGLPSDSAGIWLGGVTGKINKVEITGHSPGMGIMIVNCSELNLNQVNIHDMVWRPWNSKPQLELEKVSQNWNGISSWELSKTGTEVFPNIFFDWQRIQEKIAGIHLVNSEKITIQNSQIHRLQARMKNGELIDYQTDGITVGSHCRNILLKNLEISHVWEGIDLTGNPLNHVTIMNSKVSDAHAFGFKMANGARNVTIKNTQALRCGLSGYVISGKNNPKHTAPGSGDILIDHALSKNSGSNGYWKDQATIAGFRIMSSKLQNPYHVRIQNSQAVDDQEVKTMLFGFHEETAGDPPNSLHNVTSIGHLREESRGF